MGYMGNDGGDGGDGTEIEYFAAKSAKDAVASLRDRADSWFDTLINNLYLYKVKKAYNSYH